MENKEHSLKKTARLAGLLALVMGIPAPFALLYVPSKIIVSGDAAATANNMLANEFLFRAGIVAHLFHVIVFIFFVLALFRLLKSVNENRAKLMVLLVVVQVPIIFLIETFNFSALMILKSEVVLKSFEPTQVQDLSMLLLRMSRYGITLLEIFWGLWLIPYALLVYKSGFIPRLLGVLLIINGMGWIVESLAFLLLQRSEYLFVHQFTTLTYFGELIMVLWLLIKGVKNNIPTINNLIQH